MGKDILTFGDISIEKNKFQSKKNKLNSCFFKRYKY